MLVCLALQGAERGRRSSTLNAVKNTRRANELHAKNFNEEKNRAHHKQNEIPVKEWFSHFHSVQKLNQD